MKAGMMVGTVVVVLGMALPQTAFARKSARTGINFGTSVRMLSEQDRSQAGELSDKNTKVRSDSQQVNPYLGYSFGSFNLGLVYTMDISKQEDGGHKVDIAMTLTAPGCGMGPVIAEDAKNKVLLVPGVSAADVRITWEPPWNQSMISEEGKMKLGLI